MIYFGFNIVNPRSKRWDNVWCHAYKTPFKNKFIELELVKDTSIVAFTFKLSHWTDHGGLYIDLGLVGYNISFNFYDSRHWDHKNNCWEKYNE
jgi:hypothetical protein